VESGRRDEGGPSLGPWHGTDGMEATAWGAGCSVPQAPKQAGGGAVRMGRRSKGRQSRRSACTGGKERGEAKQEEGMCVERGGGIGQGTDGLHELADLLLGHGAPGVAQALGAAPRR